MPFEMDWIKSLQCPRCCARELTIQPKPGDDDPLPARGEAMCARCGARYPIADHVLNLTLRGDGNRRTMAGWSNELPLAPQTYENVWRPRSLSVLTGQSFPVWREIALVTEWLAAKPDELVVDFGSSTDLYARGIARAAKNDGAPAIVAIDLALRMLRAGRSYARREGITNIAHVRAPADRLPFARTSLRPVPITFFPTGRWRIPKGPR